MRVVVQADVEEALRFDPSGGECFASFTGLSLGQVLACETQTGRGVVESARRETILKRQTERIATGTPR